MLPLLKNPRGAAGRRGQDRDRDGGWGLRAEGWSHLPPFRASLALPRKRQKHHLRWGRSSYI